MPTRYSPWTGSETVYNQATAKRDKAWRSWREHVSSPPLKNALKSRSRFIGFRYQINGNAFLPPSIFFFSFFFYFRNSLDRDDSTFTRDFMAGISCPIPRRESWSTYFRISNIQQLAGNGAVARNRGRAELRGGEEFCPAIAAPGRKK